MERWQRVILVTLAGLASGTVGACGLLPGETYEDDSSVRQKITSVHIDSRAGSVVVRGAKDSKETTVHRVVEYHGERPGATHRIDDGRLVLGACDGSCEVDYTVVVPAGIPVSGETSNGHVTLSQVGAVDVATSSGRIAMDGVTGPVKARTTNGRINGVALDGSGIRVQTSNGDINLTPASAQSIRAETSNGRITVNAPAGPYRISARTVNGEKNLQIRNDPSGRFRLDLTTNNGDITVKPGS